MIGILCLPVDHLETFKDVYDIIDPATLHCKLSRALVEVKHGAVFASIETKEAAAELPQALLLATVLALRLEVSDGVGGQFLKFFFHRGIITIFILAVNILQEFFILILLRLLPKTCSTRIILTSLLRLAQSSTHARRLSYSPSPASILLLRESSVSQN